MNNSERVIRAEKRRKRTGFVLRHLLLVALLVARRLPLVFGLLDVLPALAELLGDVAHFPVGVNLLHLRPLLLAEHEERAHRALRGVRVLVALLAFALSALAHCWSRVLHTQRRKHLPVPTLDEFGMRAGRCYLRADCANAHALLNANAAMRQCTVLLLRQRQAVGSGQWCSGAAAVRGTASDWGHIPVRNIR